MRKILLGAFAVGSLDITYAIAFWVPRGGKVIRIFQSIAAGLLGPDAFQGGVPTALLGAALHYFIALAIVTAYWAAAHYIPLLVRHPIMCGALYGVGVYGVMNYVVIPLSNAKPGKFLLSWVVCSVIVHAFLIGVPAALFAREATLPDNVSGARSRTSPGGSR
ncbi:MAG TPA: hypothetical protein VK504_11755 [Vicinamibacterales bacterium]|nr:hypothetical protein [Vicinamibacterales bacterium]